MALPVIQPHEATMEKKETPSETQKRPEPEHAAAHAHHPHPEHATPTGEKLAILLIAIVSLIVLFNQFQITQVSSMLTTGASATFASSGPSAGKTGGVIQLDSTGDVVNDVIKAMIPTGTPEEYGAELGVTFDDPVAGIDILARLDRAIPTSSLTAAEKERYIAVTSHISCEFCCSAPAITDSSGRDLCGCAHSAAFRGLTKYLVKNHPDSWTNDEIYGELTRWKSLFYPKNMVQKGVALANAGLELDAAALNDAQLLQKLQSGNTQVGGDLSSLPNMVGGC
ncbi:hypothetical protein HY493_01140 [Candidatus Woesearchaeota archaeon]|nr:hypothetical protein [Candidatus Woesearchaeota archaeon]